MLLQVDALKADLARDQARVTELLNDFASLDVVVNTDVSLNLTSNIELVGINGA